VRRGGEAAAPLTWDSRRRYRPGPTRPVGSVMFCAAVRYAVRRRCGVAVCGELVESWVAVAVHSVGDDLDGQPGRDSFGIGPFRERRRERAPGS
jgi:hypothetical protein